MSSCRTFLANVFGSGLFTLNLTVRVHSTDSVLNGRTREELFKIRMNDVIMGSTGGF